MRTQRMQGRFGRRGAVVVAALALGLAGVLPATAEVNAAVWDPEEPTPLTMPGTAVSLARAGEMGLWGDNAYGQSTVPAELEGVAIKQLARPDGRSMLALTAAGHVVGWGLGTYKNEEIPAAVSAAKVAQIATGSYASGYAGAVTTDGRVLVWGKARKTASPLQVPRGLTGVKQLVIGAFSAGAVKDDGSVVVWGLLKSLAEPAAYTATPPAGLKATAIATDGVNHWLGLKPDGSLVSWGSPMSSGPLPASLKVPGSVKAIVAQSTSFLVLLADNTLKSLGQAPPPAAFLATDAVLLASGPGNDEVAVVDRDRNIRYWTSATDLGGGVPEDFNGRDLAQITIGHWTAGSLGDPQVPNGGVIITKMLRAELPQVTGAPVVGATVTGVPGTFSAVPDSVSGKWLVDGAEIPGQTGATLSLTADLLGKQVSYRSTATKTGQTTISSTSAAVKVKIPATVGLSVAKGSYGTAATVTASVAGAAGTVSLTVDGKPVGTKALVGGKASFSAPRTTAPGNHAVRATYAGGDTRGPGTASGTLRVGKGRTGTPTLKVAKASPKKKGTVTVTVPTAVGLVKATGKAKLVLKKAKTTKKVTLTISNGKATAKLPKLPKGKWTATVTYQGNTYYLASGPTRIKFKSK